MAGTDLKDARRRAKWTQAKAASKLGLTQAYLSMGESGHRPVTSSVTEVALKVFNLPPTVLSSTRSGERTGCRFHTKGFAGYDVNRICIFRQNFRVAQEGDSPRRNV